MAFAGSLCDIYGQSPDPTLINTSYLPQKKTWEDFIDYITENDDIFEDEESLAYLEEYEELTHHPININKATKEELLTIPFIGEREANDIRDYIARHREMKSIYELVYIPSISYQARSFLPLFLYVSNDPAPVYQPSLKEMLSEHKHEFLSRLDIPLYYREGDMRKDGYRGSPLYNKTKYTFSATSHLSASLHFERDAGEKGIDSYGGYLMIKDRGKLANLIVGDYRVSYGEGLVMNQGFRLGKSFLLNTSGKGIRAHTGTDEVNYLRGLGATIKWNHFNTSLFLSHRKLDATLYEDSCAITIQKNGYHRTEAEYLRKGNLGVSTLGAHIGWETAKAHLGVSGYWMHTSLPLYRGEQIYRQIAPEGKDFGAMSIDYGLKSYRWNLHGETAYHPNQNGIATLNTLDWRASNRYTFSLIQRYYDIHYYSYYSRSISENTNVQNETAMTLRINARPTDGLQVTSFLDFFYNPWPRYGLTHSSKGQEFYLSGTYTINKANQFSILYNLKNKEVSKGQQCHHRIKLQWKGQITNKWQHQTTAFLHTLKNSHGYAIAESVSYGNNNNSPILTTISGTYFNTTDYDSRIFIYEKNVAQAMYVPTLSGEGIRITSNIRWNNKNQKIRLELKYGYTQYLDGRKQQSTGMETIYSSAKHNITIQATYRM